MKLILNFIKTVLIILAIADLFMLLIANGSGHNIPAKTNVTIITTFLILILLAGLANWLKKLTE